MSAEGKRRHPMKKKKNHLHPMMSNLVDAMAISSCLGERFYMHFMMCYARVVSLYL